MRFFYKNPERQPLVKNHDKSNNQNQVKNKKNKNEVDSIILVVAAYLSVFSGMAISRSLRNSMGPYYLIAIDAGVMSTVFTFLAVLLHQLKKSSIQKNEMISSKYSGATSNVEHMQCNKCI